MQPDKIQRLGFDFSSSKDLDLAQNYLNEDEIGDALHELFQAGTVKREQLWITGEHARQVVCVTMLTWQWQAS